MKALIIGIDGFVGGHLKSELISNGYEVVGTALNHSDENIRVMDILDLQSISKVISEVKPDVIFHMAGQSSVALSWKEPRLTFDLNVNGTINILEVVKNFNTKIKILIVGSSDQYGKVSNDNFFVDESVPLNPTTPYAISKCTQEQIALLYARDYGMNVYLTRSFNHIGVGQKKGFVIPDVASGIADIEAGKANRLLVGNLSAERDFSDVRDIVRAYRLIVEKGKSNTVYNVGSGNTYSIENLINTLISMSKCTISVESDAARMRKSDTPVIKCNNSRLIEDTGWNPQFDINTTLEDVLNSFRKANGI